MLNYMVGKINYINNKFIVFENNWVGYSVNVANANDFELNTVCRVYLYQVNRIDNKNNVVSELYGFRTLEGKLLFVSLLTVPGIGPKTAMTLLKNDHKVIINLISTHNIKELERLPNFTPKFAKAIVDTLSKNYYYSKNNNVEEDDEKSYSLGDLNDALLTMGYSKEDISYSLSNLSQDSEKMDLSDALSSCIKFIATKTNPSETPKV